MVYVKTFYKLTMAEGSCASKSGYLFLEILCAKQTTVWLGSLSLLIVIKHADAPAFCIFHKARSIEE